MSAAKWDLTSLDRELWSGAPIAPGRDRHSASRCIASAAAMGSGCVYAPLMYVRPSGIAKSPFLGNVSSDDAGTMALIDRPCARALARENVDMAASPPIPVKKLRRL